MAKKAKRKVDLLVISDIHLGTRGCHAKELVTYLQSIRPSRVILNGDIIDIWQFNKRFFPKSHVKVLKIFLSWLSKGIPIHYVVGNHDESLRKFNGLKWGSLEIANKLLIDLNGKKAWVFHGDVFDITMQHSKLIAKLGAIGYDALIILNRAVNLVLKKMGRPAFSLSKRIKNSVKSAVKFINHFEQTAADIAIENGYDYVVCGHIHQPEVRDFENENGQTIYLNSGDWIENLTALEWHKGKWTLYQYEEESLIESIKEEDEPKNNKELFQLMVEEFNALKSANKVA